MNYNISKHNSLLKWYRPDGYSNVNVIEFPGAELKKVSIDMCTQPKLSPSNMYKTYATDNKPNILVNCSFFAASTGESIFNLVSNGVVYSENNDLAYKNGYGVTKAGAFDSGSYIKDYWEDFTTAYPVLILNSKALPIVTAEEINYKAHRNILGWTKNKETIFNIGIEGSGMTFEEVQNFIFKLYPTVEYAANNDGGGSLVQLFDGNKISDIGWERPVDNVLSIWVRSDAERAQAEKEQAEKEAAEAQKPKKVGYRVQLGAFSKKDNAINYCKEIRSLKSNVIDYSKAFTTYDDTRNLYRVQVGFFSKKENAQKVVDDLSRLGFGSFIRYVEE